MQVSNLLALLQGGRAEAGESLAGTRQISSPFIDLLSILKGIQPAPKSAGGGLPLAEAGKEEKVAAKDGKPLPPDGTQQPCLPLFFSQPSGTPMPPRFKSAETALASRRELVTRGEGPPSIALQAGGMPDKGTALAAAIPGFPSLMQTASREQHFSALSVLDAGYFSPVPAGALPMHPHADPAPLALAGVDGALGKPHGPAADALLQPLGTPAWEKGLEQKVVWMLGRETQHASLQLNPPHLGPLEIHLKLKDDQASAWFLTPHEAVRDALEAALPRLRESMQSHGVHLSASWLSADAQSQFGTHQGQTGQAHIHGGRSFFQEPAPDGLQAAVSVVEKRGLVNLFI